MGLGPCGELRYPAYQARSHPHTGLWFRPCACKTIPLCFASAYPTVSCDIAAGGGREVELLWADSWRGWGAHRAAGHPRCALWHEAALLLCKRPAMSLHRATAQHSAVPRHWRVPVLRPLYAGQPEGGRGGGRPPRVVRESIPCTPHGMCSSCIKKALLCMQRIAHSCGDYDRFGFFFIFSIYQLLQGKSTARWRRQLRLCTLVNP